MIKLKGKKGWIQIVGFLVPLLLNIWFWVLAVAAILIFYTLTFFMLGKIIATILIVGGLVTFLKTKNWYIMGFLIGIGLLMFFNPMGWESLSFMR